MNAISTLWRAADRLEERVDEVEVGEDAVRVGDVPADGDVVDPSAARTCPQPEERRDPLEVTMARDAERRLVGEREELDVLLEARRPSGTRR